MVWNLAVPRKRGSPPATSDWPGSQKLALPLRRARQSAERPAPPQGDRLFTRSPLFCVAAYCGSQDIANRHDIVQVAPLALTTAGLLELKSGEIARRSISLGVWKAMVCHVIEARCWRPLVEDIQLAAGNARRVVFGKLKPDFAALTDGNCRILDDLIRRWRAMLTLVKSAMVTLYRPRRVRR